MSDRFFLAGVVLAAVMALVSGNYAALFAVLGWFATLCRCRCGHDGDRR